MVRGVDYEKLSYGLLAAVVAVALAALGLSRYTGFLTAGLDVLFVLGAGVLIVGGVLFHLMRQTLRRLPRERHEELADLLKNGLSLPYIVAVSAAFAYALHVYVESRVLMFVLALLWTLAIALQYAVYQFHVEMAERDEFDELRAQP